MNKVLLTSALLAAGIANQASAQVWSETFNSGIPATWTLINVDGKTPTSADFNTLITNTLGGASGKAWMSWPRATGDSCALTVSDFTPAGQADRWLISPSFQVNSANMFLVWEDEVASANYPDSMQVLVSPTAGNTAASFTATLSNNKGGTSGWTTHAVPLGTYNGTTIRVAFRNHSTDQYALLMDNPQTLILPNNDLALTSISPTFPGTTTVGAVGSNFTIKGNVKNMGATTVTSYTVKYQQGSNPVVSETKTGNIPAYGTASFTFSTPYNLAAAGRYPVKVWVELAGDGNHANDSSATAFASIPSNNTITKKLMFEEGTGTWCGWCVRGIVYMDSFRKVNGGLAGQVAVHNSDPMTLAAYDAYITSLPGFTGFPGMAVDRREIKDPSEIFTTYNAEKNYYGFADITMGTPTISGTSISLPITIKPGIDLSGDIRPVLVVEEDQVHNGTTGGTWDQHNYYSSQSQNQPLSGGGVNYQTLPAVIPATQMYYDFVGRATIPSVTGTAGVLPANMTAGSTYNYTFSGTISTSWAQSKLNYTVMLVNGASGEVLNTQTTLKPTSVANISAGVNDLNIYPNPTKDAAYVTITLDKATSVTMQVIDAMGRVVDNTATQHMQAGENRMTISTASLASGIYYVKITTDKGSVTERLSVIK